MKIFIPLVGQFTNIGDTLHRKILINWLRESGDLHLYVGNASDSFLSGLDLSGREKIVRNPMAWYWAALTSGPSSVLFFCPGEVSASYRRVLKELVFLPLILSFFLKRGVFRVGIAFREYSSFAMRLLNAVYRRSRLLVWRDCNSYRKAKSGHLYPDLGFWAQQVCDNSSETISISYRGDRPLPPTEVFRAIAEFSQANAVPIIVFSQVRRDNGAAQECAELLQKVGAEPSLLLWEDDIDHRTQEERMNQVYSRSMLTVSDRLHALIMASCRGAIPLCLTAAVNPKVEEHFCAIGLKDIAHGVSGKSAVEIHSVIEAQCSRGAEIKTEVVKARIKLSELRQLVKNTIR
ncbi:polysaccharide pyruvyl transferase family protein [Pelagibacterium sp. H642]|uniref:polysaccharide pyruvyl transferase family protein n=1 Tax=Pelagibacterium sp. H642 TaxID=1881069 RepID=UPI0028169D2A|nr:polysaccharide pyruvyl transferase family protein [Pelagibacterium sp. H642]WMT89356.1 polysaccharide pyruvyl transferase family protein [Pelagibacterium sp. H642]